MRYIDEVKDIHPRDSVLEVKMTGVELFYDGLPGHTIVFDNENKVAHALRKTMTRRPDLGDPEYEIVTLNYDQIQTIRSFVDKNEIEEILDKFVAKNLIPDSAKEDLIKDLIQE